MAKDVLIDLGPEWGHIVPLSVLEKITHIEFLADGHIQVVCESGEERKKDFRFKSRKAFDDDTGEKEKNRLLGYSNGMIPRDDVKKIISSMEAQTGQNFDETLDNISYDISFIRRIWATFNGEPYFRFVLQYDPETQNVEIDEDHNDDFEGIPSDWSDPEIMKELSIDDQLLLFVYEVLYQMVEPFMPEGEAGGYDRNLEDIPVMATRGPTTRVDLANINPNQIMASTGGNS